MFKLEFVHRTSDDDAAAAAAAADDDDDAEEGKEVNWRTFTKLYFPPVTCK